VYNREADSAATAQLIGKALAGRKEVMDRELQREWRTLEDEALALLRKHDDSDPGFLVDATLLVLPSFEDCWAYSILRSVRDSEAPAKVQRRVWRRTVDLRKLDTPIARLRHSGHLAPTIESSKKDVLKSSARALLDRIVHSHLPPFTLERSLGMDGTSYEVSFGYTFVTSQFCWWESPPDGWQPLQQFVDDVRTLVDAAVAGAG
jgi:hypothetical protein